MNIKNILEKSERAVILYHIDTDGVCSAKIMSEALKRLNKEVVNYFPTTPRLLNSEDFQTGIERSSPDLIIIVDVELREDCSLFKRNRNRNFLILDHHGVDKIPKGENIVYINPKLQGVEKFIPAARIVFEEMNQIIDINDLDWVSAVGVIGDAGAPFHKKFLKRIMEKYKVKEEKDKDYYFDTFFGLLSNLINCGKIVKGNDGAQTALKILQDSSTPKEFYEKAYKLRMWNDKVEDYIEATILDFEKKKEAYENLDLYFFTFKPEYTVGSVLSTIVSFKHPDKTVIIFSKKNGTTTINYRRQDGKYDMSRLAKNSIKGLRNAGGGGHVPAAGGHVQTKDINYLKRNIISELKKMMGLVPSQ